MDEQELQHLHEALEMLAGQFACCEEEAPPPTGYAQNTPPYHEKSFLDDLADWNRDNRAGFVDDRQMPDPNFYGTAGGHAPVGSGQLFGQNPTASSFQHVARPSEYAEPVPWENPRPGDERIWNSFLADQQIRDKQKQERWNNFMESRGKPFQGPTGQHPHRPTMESMYAEHQWHQDDFDPDHEHNREADTDWDEEATDYAPPMRQGHAPEFDDADRATALAQQENTPEAHNQAAVAHFRAFHVAHPEDTGRRNHHRARMLEHDSQGRNTRQWMGQGGTGYDLGEQRGFEQELDANPLSPTAHGIYGWWLGQHGQPQLARTHNRIHKNIPHLDPSKWESGPDWRDALEGEMDLGSYSQYAEGGMEEDYASAPTEHTAESLSEHAINSTRRHIASQNPNTHRRLANIHADAMHAHHDAGDPDMGNYHQEAVGFHHDRANALESRATRPQPNPSSPWGEGVDYDLNTQRVFEEQLDQRPHDATLQGGYADWLEEQGANRHAAQQRHVAQQIPNYPLLQTHGGAGSRDWFEGLVDRHRQEQEGWGNPEHLAAYEGPSPEKARIMLHEGTVHGHPITDKQRKFFGWKSHQHSAYAEQTPFDPNAPSAPPMWQEHGGVIGAREHRARGALTGLDPIERPFHTGIDVTIKGTPGRTMDWANHPDAAEKQAWEDYLNSHEGMTDDNSRGVFADWLEGRGDTVGAHKQRAMGGFAPAQLGQNPYSAYADPAGHPHLQTEHPGHSGIGRKGNIFRPGHFTTRPPFRTGPSRAGITGSPMTRTRSNLRGLLSRGFSHDEAVNLVHRSRRPLNSAMYADPAGHPESQGKHTRSGFRTGPSGAKVTGFPTTTHHDSSDEDNERAYHERRQSGEGHDEYMPDVDYTSPMGYASPVDLSGAGMGTAGHDDPRWFTSGRPSGKGPSMQEAWQEVSSHPEFHNMPPAEVQQRIRSFVEGTDPEMPDWSPGELDEGQHSILDWMEARNDPTGPFHRPHFTSPHGAAIFSRYGEYDAAGMVDEDGHEMDMRRPPIMYPPPPARRYSNDGSVRAGNWVTPTTNYAPLPPSRPRDWFATGRGRVRGGARMLRGTHPRAHYEGRDDGHSRHAGPPDEGPIPWGGQVGPPPPPRPMASDVGHARRMAARGAFAPGHGPWNERDESSGVSGEQPQLPYGEGEGQRYARPFSAYDLNDQRTWEEYLDAHPDEAAAHGGYADFLDESGAPQHAAQHRHLSQKLPGWSPGRGIERDRERGYDQRQGNRDELERMGESSRRAHELSALAEQEGTREAHDNAALAHATAHNRMYFNQGGSYEDLMEHERLHAHHANMRARLSVPTAPDEPEEEYAAYDAHQLREDAFYGAEDYPDAGMYSQSSEPQPDASQGHTNGYGQNSGVALNGTPSRTVGNYPRGGYGG